MHSVHIPKCYNLNITDFNIILPPVFQVVSFLKTMYVLLSHSSSATYPTYLTLVKLDNPNNIHGYARITRVNAVRFSPGYIS